MLRFLSCAKGEGRWSSFHSEELRTSEDRPAQNEAGHGSRGHRARCRDRAAALAQDRALADHIPPDLEIEVSGPGRYEPNPEPDGPVVVIHFTWCNVRVIAERDETNNGSNHATYVSPPRRRTSPSP